MLTPLPHPSSLVFALSPQTGYNIFVRVLIISKACIVGQYQTKLEALAHCPDMELTVVVPPRWLDERGTVRFERAFTRGYKMRVEPIALNGHFHLHYYPTVPRIIRDLRPDIVHIDEEPYNWATFHALYAARAAHAKTLFFTWQNLHRRYPPPFAWMEWYVLSHVNYAVVGNREAAEVLRAKNYRGPLRVIPQFGVDPERYRGAPSAADTPFRIGYCGRLVEEKGVQVLLEAAARLAGNWELSIRGAGPFQSQLEGQARDLKIDSRVHFEPWVSSREMPACYRHMDVLVLPSLTRPNWKEQFGRVLIEAMACQVPVVGSNCGEVPNVIGDAGLVFGEGDVSALAAQLDALMRDPVRRADLGRRGRIRVLAHYTQEQIAEETFTVYREIMDKETR